MKKLLIALPLAVLMLSLSLAVVSAGVDWEDPALCVDGRWLTVDAAHAPAITVFVPEGTRYGDQNAGGCKTPAPAIPLIQNVKVRGDANLLFVQIDGRQASTPTVKASYAGATQTKANDGNGKLNFHFNLPRHGD